MIDLCISSDRPSVRNTVSSPSDEKIILNHSILAYNSLQTVGKCAMLQHLICFVHAGPTLCSSQEILPPLRRRQMPRCAPSQPTPPSATPRAHLGPAFPFCSPPPFPHLHACTTCVPPAPLPASQRWPALPSRMPAPGASRSPRAEHVPVPLARRYRPRRPGGKLRAVLL